MKNKNLVLLKSSRSWPSPRSQKSQWKRVRIDKLARRIGTSSNEQQFLFQLLSYFQAFMHFKLKSGENWHALLMTFHVSLSMF